MASYDPGDPFRSHLIALLSAYALGPGSLSLPKYTGPSDWQTDSILHTLSDFAGRMNRAEKALWSLGTDSKQVSAIKATTMAAPPTTTSTRAPAAPTSINLDDLSSSDSAPSFFHKNIPVHTADVSSASPVAEFVYCPTCSTRFTDSDLVKRMSLFGIKPSPNSPLIVTPSGPLATVAVESGLSAVEELKLLKDQVQDVARVCNAVANGDLSQKITVEVRGAVMVSLKDAINTMVRALSFALSPLNNTLSIFRLRNSANSRKK